MRLELPDVPHERVPKTWRAPLVASDRLSAVLEHVPQSTRVRVTNALYAHDIFTLEALCRLPHRELFKWKNVGRKCVADLVDALAVSGCQLADDPSRLLQSPSKRLADPAWLRAQVRRLMEIGNAEIADLTDRGGHDPTDHDIAARRASAAHWVRRLEHLLRGATQDEGEI